MNTPFQQRAAGLMSHPGNGWRKLLTKAPIHLWRLGLGLVIGYVMMLITHTGRKSGLPRRTMVEYHMLKGKKYVPCAFGRKSDWYKNIAADPHVTIQTAYGVERMTAVRVTDDQELLAVYELFKRRSPPLLNWYMQSLDIRHDPADILAKKDRIYWIRFDQTNEPTPPPLMTDLIWVWPTIFVGPLVLWRLWRKKEA